MIQIPLAIAIVLQVVSVIQTDSESATLFGQIMQLQIKLSHIKYNYKNKTSKPLVQAFLLVVSQVQELQKCYVFHQSSVFIMMS